MSRRQQAESNGKPRQIKDLAFTIRGHAMVDGMRARDVYEVIIARKKSTINVREAVKSMTKDKANVQIFKTDPVYSERERGEPELGLYRYLVVGYTPRSPDGSLSKTAPGSKKQQPTGVACPDNVIPWDDKEPPVLVVTEILESQPESIQLWALLRPDNGVCTPFQVSQDFVFYRHEFRDASTAIRDRASNWNKLVSIHSIRPGLALSPTAKQEKFKRARDTAKVILEPNQSFSNEVLCLALGYKRSKDLWFLKELKTVLEQADTDLNCRPPSKNIGLRKFVEQDGEFTYDDAQLVVQDIHDLWPEVEDVTAERVVLLKVGLTHKGIFLEYRLLRAFLAESCYRLSQSQSPFEDEALSSLVDGVARCAARMVPLRESTPSISLKEESALLATIRNKIKEMQVAGEIMNQRLKDLCGDTAFDGTPYDIWAHYADACDTDAARLAFFGVVRQFVAAMLRKNAGLDAMAGDIVVVLDKLQLGEN